MTHTIEVEKPVIHNVEVPVAIEPRNAEEWAVLLEAFAAELAQGRIYRRDIPVLEPSVRRVVDVWNRTFRQPS